MAGTLVANTINTDTGLFSTNNAYSGIAKAWVNFAGGNGNTAGTINGSFNVSSITVNGTGSFTVNFTTAMPNANFSAISNCNYNNSSTATVMSTVGAQTTSSCGVFATNSTSGSNLNVISVSFAALGA